MNSPFFAQFAAVNGLGHGGDAGVPVWVPMGAFGYIDFQNGQYWNGVASVGVGDVIGDDTDGYFGDTFVLAQLVAGQGYVGDGDLQTSGMIIGSLAPAIVEGSAIVFEYDLTDAAGSAALGLWSEGFTITVGVDLGSLIDLDDALSFTFDIGPNPSGDPPLGVGVHKIGVRIVDGNWAIVANGGTVYTSNHTLGGTISGVSMELQSGFTLRKIVNYDPVDDAALQALTA